MSKPRIRSSFSFPTLILSCLNFTVFIIAAVSVAPTLLLITPPASLGAALLCVSFATLGTAFVGFYSHITRCCFLTYISLMFASLLCQALAVIALFSKERWSLSMLKPRRDPREAKLLVRAECGVLMAMLVVQVAVLAAVCCVQVCWVREYHDQRVEADREASTARKRSRRVARVQEEAVANAAKMAEIKYGQAWVKTDFEG